MDFLSVGTKKSDLCREVAFSGLGSTVNTKSHVPMNRPFPSSPGPLFQNEGRCSVCDVEIIFHYHANKTHFHKKGCALGLILKVRVFGTQKWPIYRTDPKPSRYFDIMRNPTMQYNMKSGLLRVEPLLQKVVKKVGFVLARKEREK